MSRFFFQIGTTDAGHDFFLFFFFSPLLEIWSNGEMYTDFQLVSESQMCVVEWKQVKFDHTENRQAMFVSIINT